MTHGWAWLIPTKMQSRWPFVRFEPRTTGAGSQYFWLWFFKKP